VAIAGPCSFLDHHVARTCHSPETPASGTLDVWPALPLIVDGNITSPSAPDNIILAFEQSRNRACEVYLQGDWNRGWQLEKVLVLMQVPFPELSVLQLSSTFPFPIRSWVDLPHVYNTFSWHSISGIAKPDFVCYSPCLPLTLQH
jgi:hypothetical protein